MVEHIFGIGAVASDRLCDHVCVYMCVHDIFSLYSIQPGHIEFYLDGVHVAEHIFGIGAVAWDCVCV